MKRGNWEQVHRKEENQANPFTSCQFIWKPTNLSNAGYLKLDTAVKGRPRDTIQVFNHFEVLHGLCTKTGIVGSLKRYYQSRKESSID